MDAGRDRQYRHCGRWRVRHKITSQGIHERVGGKVQHDTPADPEPVFVCRWSAPGEGASHQRKGGHRQAENRLGRVGDKAEVVERLPAEEGW